MLRQKLNQSQIEQVEAFEETGEFPPEVEFVELQTDVGWYGRQCRKRIRDQVRCWRRIFGRNHIYTGQCFCVMMLPIYITITYHLKRNKINTEIEKKNMSWAESFW